MSLKKLFATAGTLNEDDQQTRSLLAQPRGLTTHAKTTKEEPVMPKDHLAIATS